MSKYHFEADYSRDSLRWLNKVDPYSKKESGYTNDDLERLQDEIVADRDSALAYFFATEFNYKTYRMQKLILDQKDAKYAFVFARDIPNADIKALQNVVISSKELKYICNFACFVEGADHKRLEKIITSAILDDPRNTQYAHKLLKNVDGSNVKKFKDIIIASKRPRYLYELAKHINNPDEIALIEDLIIQSRSFLYMRMFAENIERANLEKIEQAVLDTDNVVEIKKFAKYVKRSKMKRFFLVL